MTMPCECRSTISSTSQSKADNAPTSSGTPETDVTHWLPAKRSAPFSPPLPAKRSAMSSWSALRMFTPKAPWRRISGKDEASRLMLTSRVGGSTDSEVTEVTVMPVMSLPRPAVMTLTPPVRWRMAPRKSAEETGISVMRSRGTTFMAYSPKWGSLYLGTIVRRQKVAQDRAFETRELGRAALAGPGRVNHDVMGDPPFLDHQHPVGQRDRLGDIVGHQDRGKALIAPDALQQPLHRDAGQRVQRAKRLVEGEHTGTRDHRAGKSYALPLAARQYRGPLVALVGQSDFGQRLIGACMRITG